MKIFFTLCSFYWLTAVSASLAISEDASIGLNEVSNENDPSGSLRRHDHDEERKLRSSDGSFKKGSPTKPIWKYNPVPAPSPVKPVSFPNFRPVSIPAVRPVSKPYFQPVPAPKVQPVPAPKVQPVPAPKVQPVFFPTPVQPRSPFGCATLDTGKYFNLIARHSNMVVNVDHGSTSDGARIVQWPSNPGKNDNWRFESVGNGYYRIIAEHSQKGLYGKK
jgi:hypothetical protein